ncbi:MAG: S8 family serine peptidase [Methylotenera sp.]|nr:S8 family serine peptidase [Oligoflexia bacterium]
MKVSFIKNSLSACGALTFLICASPGHAFGKKPAKVPPAPANSFVGKKVIRLKTVQNVQIEMPDQSRYDFGQDFQERMITRLTESDHYIVSPDRPGTTSEDRIQSLSENLGSPGWSGSFVPAASLRISVDALSFSTGSGGERMFYGFNERMKTPFNDGSGKIPEEFPLRTIAFEPNWFDRTFDAKGKDPFDSRSGLDLGDGFRLEALFAWLDVKYAQYHSQLDLMLELRSPLSGKTELRKVQVTGNGYFYDVSGAYSQYGAGIMVARKDAMGQAFRKAIQGSFDAVERSLGGLPLTARIDNIVPARAPGALPQILLGTGRDAQIQLGIQYERVTEEGRLDSNSGLIRVTESVMDGAVAEIVSGDPLSFRPGQIFRQAGIVVSPLPAQQGLVSLGAGGLTSSAVPTVQESIVLPAENFKKPTFQSGQIAQVSVITATLKALVETVFLPYRIWRYTQYDQTYSKNARGSSAGSDSSALAAAKLNDLRKPPALKSEIDPSLNESLDASVNAPSNQSSELAENESVQDSALVLEKSRQDSWAKQIGWNERSAVLHAESASGGRMNGTASQGTAAGDPLKASQGAVVAIIDTGVDYNHPAIHSRLWLNPLPVLDSHQLTDRYGWDFTSGDSRPFDDAYHGTQMASAVLSIAPNAQIMPLKVFNAWGITRSASIYGAFQYAVDHGAQVILCGWATRKPTQAIERGVVYARDHGVLVVAAAGDRGDDLEKVPAYPVSLNAKYSNVLGVASVDAQDHLVQDSGRFSNFSALRIDLAAPGKEIRVAEPRNREVLETSTGVASALVAGAAARILEFGMLQGSASQADGIKAELLKAAEHIPALDASVHGGLRLRLQN